MTEINKSLFDKKILAFDSKTGQYSWVSPKILTTTIFNEKGENLDDLLKFTPAELIKMVEDILEGAPEAYNTFLEVSKGLEGNKSSITSLFKAIDKKVSMPTENKVPGYVLKLDEDLNVVFGEDKNTEYDLSGFLTSKDLADYAKTKDIPKLPDLSVYAKSETLKDYAKSADLTKFVKLDATGKISVNDLPKEALENTEYDLSPYLLSDEAARLFALKTEIPVIDLSPYAKTEDLDAYAKTEDLDNYQLLEKRGAVDGYASLGEDGKVPKEQIDFDDFKDFVKNEDLEYATIEDIADLMI